MRRGDYFQARGAWYLAVTSVVDAGGQAGRVVKGCAIRNYVITGTGRRVRVIGSDTEEGEWIRWAEVGLIEAPRRHLAEVQRRIRQGGILP